MSFNCNMNSKMFSVFHLLFSIGSVVGLALWKYYDDDFVQVDAYGFYWFVAASSFVVGCVGVGYHFRKNVPVPQNPLFMLTLSFVYFVFWLAQTIFVSVVTQSCLAYNLPCIGEIVTMSFSYAGMLTWILVLINVAFYTVEAFDSEGPPRGVSSPHDDIPVRLERGLGVGVSPSLESGNPVVETEDEMEDISLEQSHHREWRPMEDIEQPQEQLEEQQQSEEQTGEETQQSEQPLSFERLDAFPEEENN